MCSHGFGFSVVLNEPGFTFASFVPCGAGGWACRIAWPPIAPAAATATVPVAACRNSRRLT